MGAPTAHRLGIAITANDKAKATTRRRNSRFEPVNRGEDSLSPEHNRPPGDEPVPAPIEFIESNREARMSVEEGAHIASVKEREGSVFMNWVVTQSGWPNGCGREQGI